MPAADAFCMLSVDNSFTHLGPTTCLESKGNRHVVCCGAVWCGAAALSVALWCEAGHVAGAMRCDVVWCRKSGAVMGSMWWPGGAGSTVAAVAGPCA